ncbi:MAG: glycosyltransferase family 4 protein [Desulfomicrobium sp.]
MRIVYDHQIFDSQRYGGISRYFFELARHIAGLDGTDVKVVSPLFINEYLLSARVPVTGVHVPQIRRTGRIYRESNQWLAPRIMRRFRPDLIHETYYSHDTVAPSQTKVVITIHDMIHELFPECFSARDDTRIKKAIAARRADHIICVSENTRQDLIDFLGVDPAKTSVIHHGYELLAASTGLRRCEKPYILFVGGRSGYKNFDRLLQAYAASPPIYEKFQLVAFGGGALTRRERSRIQELGGGRWQVRHFSGGDEVLADLYEAAHVFVYPSLYEGFGIPALEAMSVGCPVICSDQSSLPEVVGDAAGFFDPESVDSIVVELTCALFDSAYRQGLIEKGMRRCEKFSWQRCAQETLAVYRGVLE